MNFRLLILTLMCCLCVPGPLFGAERAPSPLLYNEHYSEVIYTDIDTQETRAHSQVWLERTREGGTFTYKLLISGEGDFEDFDDVRWTKNAVMEEHEGFLRTLESTTAVYDGEGVMLRKYTKQYDHDRGRIMFTRTDGDGVVNEQRDFEIQGRTCDDVTMAYFLKPFVANLGEEGYGEFYLLTNEPRMYKVNIKDRGQERLDLPSGEVNTVKLQLMADLGPLTEVAAKMVHPTYFWYHARSPFEWVRYEGKESGYRSANVMATLARRVPPIDRD